MDFSLLGFSGLNEVFNIHPVFVHFPIALFPAALLLYFLGTVLKKPSLLFSGRACLYLGVIGGIITVLTGLAAQDSFPHNDRIHHIMQTHKMIGYWILGLATLLTAWSFWHEQQKPKGIWGFILLLTLTSLLVLQNGDLGGRMVFVEGAAVKPPNAIITSENIEIERGEDSTHKGHHHSHETPNSHH